MTSLHPADRDVERAIRSWLHEDRHEDAARIAGSVLDRVETTRQRRAPWWPGHRTPTVNRILAFSLTAAAVVAVVVLTSQVIGRPAPGGVGAQPTTTSEPVMLPSAGDLAPGVYRISDPAYTPVDLTVTVPAGWTVDRFRTLAKNPGTPMEVGLAPDVVTHVFGDACDAERTRTEVGPTADALVAALMAEENIEVTGPTDVILDGLPGQRLDLAHQSGLDAGACSDPEVPIRIWANQPVPLVYSLAVGHSGSVYVADVDGQRIVVGTDTGPDASAADIAERDTIIGSMRIGPTPSAP